MSSALWLAFALVGTFMTITVVGVAIDMALGERHRPMTLLRAQVGEVGEGVNLRERQLEHSAFERLVLPSVQRVGSFLQKLTPFDLYRRVNQKLVLAGSPRGWTAERVVGLKILLGIGGLVFGGFIGGALPLGGILRIVFVAVFPLLGFTLPTAYVTSLAAKRQKGLQRALPDTMDLLTISVEAGLGFDAALAQVTRNVPGPLSEEISRVLQEMQIGVSRADAFRHLSDRTDVQELDGFVLSMIQADLFGIPMANVLRAQSRELRVKRRQRAEEIAQKIPVKILFPLIFFVLPALFAVIMGPGAIKIYHQFFAH
jgi:tight adherence protein C